MGRRTTVVAVTATAVLFSLTPASAAVRYLMLGGTNKVGSVTTLQGTAGTPLKLVAPSGKAPFAVNSSTRVTNLNADKLDGLSAGNFARSTIRTGVITSTDVVEIPFADGVVQYIEASCPRGYPMTGGGGEGVGLTINGPLDSSTWVVSGSEARMAYAVCLSPQGLPMPGATVFKAFGSDLMKELRERNPDE